MSNLIPSRPTVPSASSLHSAPAGGDEPIDLRRQIAVVMKRKWQLAIIALLVFLPAAISTFLARPTYRATVVLQIDPEPVRILPYQDPTEPLVGGNYNYELYMKTQDQILRSPTLAARVQARLAQDASRNPQESLEIAENLEIQRVTESQLVKLSFVAGEPRLAARVVNLFAEEYIKQHFDSKQKTTEKAAGFLQSRLTELKAKIESSEKELIQYVRDRGMLDFTGDQPNVIQQRFDFLAQELAKVEAELFAAEARYRGLETATVARFPEKLNTATIASLAARVYQMEQELTSLNSKFGENWPEVIQKKQEIARVTEQLRLAKQSGLNQAVEQSRMEYEAVRKRHVMIGTAFERQKRAIDSLNDASIQFNILKREVSTNKELYEGLLQRLKQTGVTPGLEFSNIHVVEPGRPDYSVYRPRKAWNLSLAAFLALGLGGVLVFFFEFFDRSLKFPEELERLGLPSLGVVPLLKEVQGHVKTTALSDGKSQATLLPAHKGNGKSSNGVGKATLIPLRDCPPDVREACRTLCVSIALSNADQIPKKILITSTLPREGKSTLTAYLGATLADSGVPTVLVDLDLRKPTLAGLLGVADRPGASLFLSGNSDPSQLPELNETRVRNLFLLPSGPKPPNPIALLSSERARVMLERLAMDFKFVLIDSPPLLTVADARVLAPQVDGVVMIVRAGQTSRELLKRASHLVETSGGRILGVALNGVDVEASQYKYYYREYTDQSYYSDRSESHRTVCN